MKLLRSMALWMVAGGLLSGGGNVVRSQQGSGRGAGSQTNQPTSPMPPMGMPMGADEPSLDRSRMEVEQAKVRNSDRQKKLVNDTERLLSLANELKVDVDRSSKDTLSLDVIKKAEEIEKLAHSVKERMKAN